MIYAEYAVYRTDKTIEEYNGRYNSISDLKSLIEYVSKYHDVDRVEIISVEEFEQCEEETDEESEQAAEEETAAASCSAVADDTSPAK